MKIAILLLVLSIDRLPMMPAPRLGPPPKIQRNLNPPKKKPGWVRRDVKWAEVKDLMPIPGDGNRNHPINVQFLYHFPIWRIID